MKVLNTGNFMQVLDILCDIWAILRSWQLHTAAMGGQNGWKYCFLSDICLQQISFHTTGSSKTNLFHKAFYILTGFYSFNLVTIQLDSCDNLTWSTTLTRILLITKLALPQKASFDRFPYNTWISYQIKSKLSVFWW